MEYDIKEEDKGTRDAIFNLRVLCERAIEVQKRVYILFLDYEKSFDRVNHTKLVEFRCGMTWKRPQRYPKPVLGPNGKGI